MKNKRNVLTGLIIMLTAIIYSAANAQQKKIPHTQVAIYQLDVKKSKLLWKAPRNKHHGFIMFNSGSLSNFIAGWPTTGTFSIDMKSMRSTDGATTADRKKVDDKLKSEDFFDVPKYPVAAMVVNKIFPVPNSSTFSVYGTLTIKGITKPIEFTTKMKRQGNTITATADTRINRANWNIDHHPNPTGWNILERVQDHLIDNEIAVSLELVFTEK